MLPWLMSVMLLPPALCAVLLAATRPADASWPLAIALLLMCAVSVWMSRRVTARGARVLLVIASAALLLWPEMGLRLAAFDSADAGVIEFGYPRPHRMIRLRKDPELFWKLPPGGAINSEGFSGPEFVVPKPAGVERIVFFGDSCMQQGLPTVAVEQLNRANGRSRVRRVAGRVDGINLGVSGYSSHQGLVLAQRWSDKLEADAVVIYFGWNDHWLAYGASDAQRAAQRSGFAGALNDSRIVLWLGSRAPSPSQVPLPVARVSLAEYRANLIAIGEIAEARGARILLVTAPSSHEALGVPTHLVAKGFADSDESVVEWHRAYNAEVRRIAAERGWLLVDLMQRTRSARGLNALFMEDGIHFTKAGLAWAGSAIATILRNAPARPINR